MGTLNASIGVVKEHYEDIMSALGKVAMNEIADHPTDEEVEVILPLLLKAKRFADASMEYAVEQAEELNVIRSRMYTMNEKLDQIDRRFDKIEQMIERLSVKIES